MQTFLRNREVAEFVSGAMAGAMTKAVLAPRETIRYLPILCSIHLCIDSTKFDILLIIVKFRYRTLEEEYRTRQVLTY